MKFPRHEPDAFFFMDDSQGEVNPSIFESVCVGVLLGLFVLVVITQTVLR